MSLNVEKTNTNLDKKLKHRLYLILFVFLIHTKKIDNSIHIPLIIIPLRVNQLKQRPKSVCCQFKTHNEIIQY